MIRTTDAQMNALVKELEQRNAPRNERLWTFLVASLLDGAPDQAALMGRMCGEPVAVPKRLDVWFEAEPIPPRHGTDGKSEGNTMLDMAFGHIALRANTRGGIEYGPHQTRSWVCFVEAKCLSDCSTTVTYDPLRNQLTRVIENVLSFQANGQFPDRVFFSLLTPRLFKDHPGARLYGYKMREYEDHDRLLADIEACCIAKRCQPGFVFPDDLKQRLTALRVNWVTYEELLGPAFDLTVVTERKGVKEWKARVSEAFARAQQARTGGRALVAV
jgi:hypothetical protein